MSVPLAPLLLLPPSKGKAGGGDGPPLQLLLAAGGPLADPRRDVLAAIDADVDGLEDRAVARIAGVGRTKAGAARELLAGVATAPTLPAHRRYTGVVHGNAGLTALDPSTVRAEVRIVSGLLGLVGLDEPVPDYRLEFGAALPTLGGLGPFWRTALRDHLTGLAAGRRVWDLLPGEHRRVWDPAVRGAVHDLVDVAFVRPDGRPANAARTKVAKGRLAAAVIAEPGLGPRDIAADVDLGPGWQVEAGEGRVTATYTAD